MAGRASGGMQPSLLQLLPREIRERVYFYAGIPVAGQWNHLCLRGTYTQNPCAAAKCFEFVQENYLNQFRLYMQGRAPSLPMPIKPLWGGEGRKLVTVTRVCFHTSLPTHILIQGFESGEDSWVSVL